MSGSVVTYNSGEEPEMKLYAGIDLHSNNSMVTVIDEQDRVVAEKRLPNELERIVLMLAAFRDALVGIVVESTFNWYWLVDGLMQAGFRVHLANTAAIQQYAGIKYTDDAHDARWLAHLLRLMVALGFNEMVNNPLIPKAEAQITGNPIEIANPQSQDMAFLRTSLLVSALTAVSSNIKKREKDLAVFEIGDTFNKMQDNLNSFQDIEEKKKLLLILSGKKLTRQWYSNEIEIMIFLI